MSRYLILYIFFALLTLSCKQKPPDGNYCAKVIYSKPGAKKPVYEMMIVEVKDNQLTDILFPDEHSDTSAIKPAMIPLDGKLTVISLSGQVYKIEMKGAPEKCISGSKTKSKKSSNAESTQCKGKSKDGKRCQRMTDNKNGLCWQHDGK